jgi:hypothetical protein
MPDSDNSGASVPTAIIVGLGFTVTALSFLTASDSSAALLKERETQIRQLEQQLNQCHYQFQGYRDGRR